MLCYGPLVSELDGPECMVPQPRHWGVVPPGPSPGSAAYEQGNVVYIRLRSRFGAAS